jgi:hypothetical protein
VQRAEPNFHVRLQPRDPHHLHAVGFAAGVVEDGSFANSSVAPEDEHTTGSGPCGFQQLANGLSFLDAIDKLDDPVLPLADEAAQDMAAP